jgi:phytol kinase
MGLWLATITTFIIALIWIRLIDFLAHKNLISSNLSRKIIHIGTGPIFVLCWLLFPEHNLSRFLAALVPLMITIQFALVGLGIIKDQSSVDAMSRKGNRKEILKGPFFYGIVFVVITIIFWRSTPAGVIALMMLCGGDGMADIIGNSFKKIPIPWAKRKSLFGSAGMLLCGWFLSLLILLIFSFAGIFSYKLGGILFPVLFISIIATLVESLPFDDIDNLTVPVISVLAAILIF